MSHEFNLKIKLENENFCNGCPCLDMVSDVCNKFGFAVELQKKPFLYFGVRQARIRHELCKENEVRND